MSKPIFFVSLVLLTALFTSTARAEDLDQKLQNSWQKVKAIGHEAYLEFLIEKETIRLHPQVEILQRDIQVFHWTRFSFSNPESVTIHDPIFERHVLANFKHFWDTDIYQSGAAGFGLYAAIDP